jgi:hypothetical protein
MFAASDPEMLIAKIALGGLAVAFFWQLIHWIRDSPTKADPWDDATEQKLSEPEAAEVCHHCFTEQPDNAWFCRHCGSAVGPYNNLMPYVCIFSEGEVFRNGASGHVRRSPLVVAGYLLLSLATLGLFAPLFWFSFIRNLKPLEKKNLESEESA